MRRHQNGFAYIAAVVFLVVLAGIAVALLRLTDTQQATVNQALLGTRAGLTARAGIEWMLHGLPARCAQGATLDDFRYASGFRVSVTCTAQGYAEGAQPDPDNPGQAETRQIRLFRIQAVACNGAGAGCPDQASVAQPDYVERAQVVTVCLREGGRIPCE